jgi:hypothetical protein
MIEDDEVCWLPNVTCGGMDPPAFTATINPAIIASHRGMSISELRYMFSKSFVMGGLAEKKPRTKWLCFKKYLFLSSKKLLLQN